MLRSVRPVRQSATSRTMLMRPQTYPHCLCGPWLPTAPEKVPITPCSRNFSVGFSDFDSGSARSFIDRRLSSIPHSKSAANGRRFWPRISILSFTKVPLVPSKSTRAVTTPFGFSFSKTNSWATRTPGHVDGPVLQPCSALVPYCSDPTGHFCRLVRQRRNA